MGKRAVTQINQITEGKLVPSLIKFAIPLMFAILLQALYGAVDLIIVGQYGNAASVSAVGMGGQFMHTVTVIIAGITMGGTVLIGRFFGAKDYVNTAKAIGNIASISAILAVVATIVVVSCAKLIAKALNLPAAAFDQGVAYIMVCGAGTVFIVGYNLLSAIFRGLGNSKLPFVFIAISCIVNILLDLLFVGLLRMDSLGAAIATVIAQGVSVILSAIFIKKRGFDFEFKKSDFKFDKTITKSLLKLGSPIAITDGLTSISFLVISAFINVFGEVASASVSIAERMFLFLIIVPMSFMAAISTFVAQNLGANNEKRVRQTLIFGTAISVAFGVCIFLFSYFGGEVIARLFTTDLDVIASSAQYLKGCSFEYLITCVTFCLVGYFNGRGKTLFVMVQGILVAFAVRIPLSYVFTNMPNVGMFRIGTAVPISAIATLILCVSYLIYVQVRVAKRHKMMI